MQTLKDARTLIEKYAVGKTVAAAVSGGEDSMALFFLLLEYARENKLKLKVVNVEHGIRENSASDSEFVARVCERERIELIAVSADIPALCEKSGRGVESEAHHFRKAVFADIISSHRADLVATAHHARDNAETILMHLFRGAGIKGLSGMNVCAHNIFRPFLTTPKRDICEYVQKCNIEFVTDETNYDTDYDRNFIRHEILPRIEERYPAFERAVTRAAYSLKSADEFISSRLDINAITENADGSVSLDEDKLDAPYVFEALSRLGKHSDVYMTAVDSVHALVTQKDCARIDLGDGIAAAREYGKVTFYRKESEKSGEEIPFVLSETSVTLDINGVQIAVERVGSAVGDCFGLRHRNDVMDAPFVGSSSAERACERTPRAQRVLRASETRGNPIHEDAHRTLIFCADGIPDTAVWRTRREGDRFTPFGGGGRKLKEYLIDKKVPQRKRDGLILLCSASEVLLIAGIEISDKLKVTEQSEKIYTVKCNA